jgi:acetyl-CoA carboxylase biotin carboxyl carrier protein
MALTFKDVAEILKIIDASDCEELVLELEGTRLVVRRGGSGAATAAVASNPGAAQTANPSPADPVAVSAPAAATPAAEAAPAEVAQVGGTHVRAPMVGTFYRRPSPGEPPFVEPGARVKTGDPLCLIEVMKLYTTIEAPADGVVETICVEDATLVEFDQLLFVIAPG